MKIAVEVTELTTELYRARCLVLPGCTVLGRSREEVEDRIAVAVRAYVASLDVSVPVDVHVFVPCSEKPSSGNTRVIGANKPGVLWP